MAGQATKVKKATATNNSCIKIDSLKRPFAQKTQSVTSWPNLGNFNYLDIGNRLAITNLLFLCLDSRGKSMILLPLKCIEGGIFVPQKLYSSFQDTDLRSMHRVKSLCGAFERVGQDCQLLGCAGLVFRID